MKTFKKMVTDRINKFREDNMNEIWVRNHEIADMAGIKTTCLYNVFNNKSSIDSSLKVLYVLEPELFDEIIKLINNE